MNAYDHFRLIVIALGVLDLDENTRLELVKSLKIRNAIKIIENFKSIGFDVMKNKGS